MNIKPRLQEKQQHLTLQYPDRWDIKRWMQQPHIAAMFDK